MYTLHTHIQIYVIRIRFSTRVAYIHMYSTAHSKNDNRISHAIYFGSPLPFSFTLVPSFCCLLLLLLTRFNLLFTLHIILFDKMPILNAVYSLSLSLVLFFVLLLLLLF